MKNVVITGFMGTGKSSVARLVAKRLGMTFVDMDEVLERRAGVPVAEIFAQRGEAAFRDLESALAAELGQKKGLAIATGGGTMLRPENREALGRTGVIVCLSCRPSELLRRLAGDGTRPLLAGEGKAERLEALLAARMPVYASLPVQVDTTGLSVAGVAAAVVREYLARQGSQGKPCKDSTST